MASQDGPLGAGEFPEFDVNHENQGCEIHIGPNDSSTARVNAELPSKALGGKLYTVPQLPIEMFENIGAGAPGTIRSISSVHPQCVSPCVDPFGVAGCKKSSPWWMCFSVFDRNKPVAIHINSDPTNAQCCNLCGLQVNGNKEGSSTPLKRHIQRKHPDVFAMLVESFGATLPGHIHAKGNSKRLSSQSKRQSSFQQRPRKKSRKQAEYPSPVAQSSTLQQQPALLRMQELESIKPFLSENEYQAKRREILDCI